MSYKILQVTGSGTTVKTGSALAAARTNERALAQNTFASDPKYKKYTQQVEKCLNSFDNVHEWADCIAFLKQLLKTFQSYMQFKEIPRKLIVAKRLAQCLNPALPTGVHQRALDVYSHILAVLGTEGLKRDLPLWSSGLFPFFEHAATSVKPTLLNLYDTHYLPLHSGLRPVMKAFILALLPGLEEETGEFFEKVLNLLDRLSGICSPSFFLQNIWLVMLTTPSARGTALNFLSRRLPRLKTEEDITKIIGRDVGLMIRSFSAALEDDNLLVRRGALDLLLSSMRIDSAAVKRAQPEDRTILMRAATGVVLRRDLSLNRRLYTWLLGPEEKSDHQIAYFREHAVEVLKSTLKDEMFSPSTDYLESRPFKIFISLLDKWEIGAVLTDVLVYDAFKAVKQFVESGSESGQDMIMTASTLYEAVEPHILWKHLLTVILDDIESDGIGHQAIEMTLFILKTFSVQDEEVQTIHLPIVFSAIVEALNLHLRERPSSGASTSTRDCLLLQEELLRHIPHTALMQRPQLTVELERMTASHGPYAFACTFYGIKRVSNLPVQQNSSVPFASIFEAMISVSMLFAQSLLEAPGNLAALRQGYSLSLLLLDRLVGRLGSSILVPWNPSKWLSVVLAILEHETANFMIVDRTISLSVALHQTKGLEPRLSIDDRSIMHKMVNKLLMYLRADCAVYHVRAVTLAWSLEAATKQRHVESIIAQSMTSPEPRNVSESYEAFGVLWRLTEDNLLPGFRFKVPIMIVLDTLRNEDPSLRRIGETWMRCSLKSYVRVLDPILYELFDPTIRRLPMANKLHGKELQGYLYECPFDQRYISHLLELILAIARFGGQGFAKTAQTTTIRRSHHTGLVERVEANGLTDSNATYLDVLVDILLRFLQSEPNQSLSATMRPLCIIIQSIAVDLLQAIVARGEIDVLSIETIEAAVIGKLYFCVHVCRLELQNKLLHLLHSVISASTSTQAPQAVKPNSDRQRYMDGVPEDNSAKDDPQDLSTRTYAVNALLIQTLMDGIASPSNRAVWQHWLDFVHMAIPQFQPTLQVVVAPLNDCLCRQLRSLLSDLLQASSSEDDISSTTTDAEFIMLLNGLERLTLLSLTNTSYGSQLEEEPIMEKPGQENSGLLGYVSNVFSSDSIPNMVDDQLTARSPGYRSLHEGVRVLFSIWATLAWSNPPTWSSKDDSLSMIYSRTRLRCRRVLEHLFRVQSAEVLESIVDCWNREQLDQKASEEAAFELVDVLIASATHAVHMLCESITCRISGASERNKKQAINPNLSDAVLFQFLEHYMSRLEGPLALQVWGRFLQLTKDVTGTSRDFKVPYYPLLRCLCVLAEKITQTTGMDDRRLRKELQDTFGKLLDSCVLYVGRSPDQGTRIRRTNVKESLTTNGRDSPGLRNELKLKLDEKMNASSSSLQDTLSSSGNAELAHQIILFIAVTALPNLRRFLVENDKVATACANIFYYIVNPALKTKSRPLGVDDNIVAVIREVTRIPPALRAWRAPVADLLSDNRFFNGNAEEASKWEAIIKALFDTDKTAFPELLAKVTTAPSSNIFTNREYELLIQSLNLRRLSYIVFTGEKNHFLTQLPTIQEKLVDILRNVSSPIVQSEVYLCIRVLLCRLSPHNLTSFWPVILTELYRLFEQVMAVLPADGSEDLQLILSACKCLDLLLVLQTEEFQIHQWIFITDTVDAVYRPENSFPEAMMDQLAEIAGNLPVAETRELSSTDNGVPATFPTILHLMEPQKMRRPMLNTLRQIDSVRDLVPFFSHVSIASYEGVYTCGGNVDWEAVEKGLMGDMFDGR